MCRLSDYCLKNFKWNLILFDGFYYVSKNSFGLIELFRDDEGENFTLVPV